MSELNPNTKPPTTDARAFLQWIFYKTTPTQLDNMVGQVALETEAELKKATPKKWFGQVRNGWKTTKPEMSVRVIGNDVRASNGAPIALFLEEGTANNGTGFIYPKKSKKLFVPLNKRAAGGWRPGLKYGVDYVLKEKVRGMKGQHIVANERPKAMERLKLGMKRIIEEVIRKEGMNAAV